MASFYEIFHVISREQEKERKITREKDFVTEVSNSGTSTFNGDSHLMFSYADDQEYTANGRQMVNCTKRREKN